MNLTILCVLMLGAIAIQAEDSNKVQPPSTPSEDSNVKKREGEQQYRIVYMTKEQLADYQRQQDTYQNLNTETPEKSKEEKPTALNEFPEPQDPIQTVNPPDDHEKQVTLQHAQEHVHHQPIPVPQYYYAPGHHHNHLPPQPQLHGPIHYLVQPQNPHHHQILLAPQHRQLVQEGHRHVQNYHPQIVQEAQHLLPGHEHLVEQRPLVHPEHQEVTHEQPQILQQRPQQIVHYYQPAAPSQHPLQTEHEQQPQTIQHDPQTIQQHPQIIQQHPQIIQQHPQLIQQHPQIIQQRPQIIEQHHTEASREHQPQLISEPQPIVDEPYPQIELHEFPQQQHRVLAAGPQPQYTESIPDHRIQATLPDKNSQHNTAPFNIILEVTKNDVSDLSHEIRHQLFYPGLSKPDNIDEIATPKPDEIKAVTEDPEPEIRTPEPKLQLVPYQNTPIAQHPITEQHFNKFLPQPNLSKTGPNKFTDTSNYLIPNDLEKRFPSHLQYAPSYFEHARTIAAKEIEAAKEKARAHAEAIAKSPAEVVHTDISIVRNRPLNIVKQVQVPFPHPVLVPVPQVQHVPVPQPYKVPLEILRPYPVSIFKTEKVEVEKRVPYEVEKRVPYDVEKKVFVKVNKPVYIERKVPVEVTKEIKVPFHVYKPKSLHIVRHVYEKSW